MSARLPVVAKVAAALLFLGVTLQLGFHLVSRINQNKGLKEKPTAQLPGSLTAVFNSFKYTHHEGGRKRYVLTAAKDQVFGDGHHDLQEVQLETFSTEGTPSGTITALKCRYDQKDAKVVFEGNVLLTTPDGLRVRTEHVDYDQKSGSAETSDRVDFARDRVGGSCVGLLLDSPAQRLEMKSEVKVRIEPVGTQARLPGEKEEGSEIPKNRRKKGKAITREPREEQGAPVDITGDWAEYSGLKKVLKLQGHARIAEPERSLSADVLTAYLSKEQKIERLEARSNCTLKSTRTDLPANLTATEMDFYFDEKGALTRAETRGESRIDAADAKAVRQLRADRLTLFTRKSEFGNELDRLEARGSVRLAMEDSDENKAFSRVLTADEVDGFYQTGGRFLSTARARGSVVVVVEPLRQTQNAERQILRTSRAALTFYPESNKAREMFADGGMRLELSSLTDPTRPQKVTESERGTATFSPATGAIETALQEGSFRYEEGVRRATAHRARYTAADAKVELREGKVAVWDDRVRTQADEIDLLTGEAFARGRVRSTYYNPASTGGAAPFRTTKSPIFITASEAHLLQKAGQAIYTGEVRAWQEESYVRSDRMELYREGSRMVAKGNVSSAFWQKKPGSLRSASESDRVVYATSAEMTYSDIERLVVYSGSVRMRQAEERLDAEQVRIYLDKGTNDVSRIEAIDRVVVCQPGRSAEGDRAEYNASTDTTVITGHNARAVSERDGSVTGRRLTLVGGGDKIFADDQRGTKRIRSTHEVRP